MKKYFSFRKPWRQNICKKVIYKSFMKLSNQFNMSPPPVQGSLQEESKTKRFKVLYCINSFSLAQFFPTLLTLRNPLQPLKPFKALEEPLKPKQILNNDLKDIIIISSAAVSCSSDFARLAGVDFGFGVTGNLGCA